MFSDLRGFLVVTLTAGLQGPSPALFWARTEIRYTVLAFRPESRAVVWMTLAVSASLCSDPFSQYRTWTQDTQTTATSDTHSLIVTYLGNKLIHRAIVFAVHMMEVSTFQMISSQPLSAGQITIMSQLGGFRAGHNVLFKFTAFWLHGCC